MLPFIHIDQAVLSRWHGKIDLVDAALVSIIRSLNPQNPAVSKYMSGPYFMFNRAYVLDLVPIVGISATTLSHRLQVLERIGLIDRRVWVNKATGKYTLYVKLSKAFWAEESRLHREAGKVAKERASRKAGKELDATVAEFDHGRNRQTPTVISDNDHKERSPEEAVFSEGATAALSGAPVTPAVSGVEESTPATPPSDEDSMLDALRRLPWRNSSPRAEDDRRAREARIEAGKQRIAEQAKWLAEREEAGEGGGTS